MVIFISSVLQVDLVLRLPKHVDAHHRDRSSVPNGHQTTSMFGLQDSPIAEREAVVLGRLRQAS
jgi:hypothetical protein